MQFIQFFDDDAAFSFCRISGTAGYPRAGYPVPDIRDPKIRQFHKQHFSFCRISVACRISAALPETLAESGKTCLLETH